MTSIEKVGRKKKVKGFVLHDFQKLILHIKTFTGGKPPQNTPLNAHFKGTFERATLPAPVSLLWAEGAPLGAVGLSHGEPPELLLQTPHSQPHLVLGALEGLQLGAVEDVEQRGGEEDGDAQRGQQVEGGAGEGLRRSQGQPGHGGDGQLQEEQSQPHGAGARRRVAHPLGAVQAHFDLGASLRHDVHQLSRLP